MNREKYTFETENLIVRPITEGDKDKYMSLRQEASYIKAAYEMLDGLPEVVWEGELNSTEDVFLAAFLIKDNVFVGSASFQHIEEDEIELGVDIVKEYRNKGIATELLTNMIRIAKREFPGKKIILTTERGNYACRKTAEKCGAVLRGYQPHPYSQLLDALFEAADKRFPDSEKMNELKQEYIPLREEHKDAICVYQFV